MEEVKLAYKLYGKRRREEALEKLQVRGDNYGSVDHNGSLTIKNAVVGDKGSVPVPGRETRSVERLNLSADQVDARMTPCDLNRHPLLISVEGDETPEAKNSINLTITIQD